MSSSGSASRCCWRSSLCCSGRCSATHDGLTGLPNRAAFNERLTSHFQPGAERRAESVSVLFMDVDDFKHVNDSLGHAAGDELLRNAAQRLAACVRPDDFLARLGGDEFAAIVVDAGEDGCAASVVAGRVLDACSVPMEIADRTVPVKLSIGVSVGHADGSVDTVLSQADFAMYTAKRGGKGRSEVFDGR
jgi:two-component system CheB/CheR fusion protein